MEVGCSDAVHDPLADLLGCLVEDDAFAQAISPRAVEGQQSKESGERIGWVQVVPPHHWHDEVLNVGGVKSQRLTEIPQPILLDFSREVVTHNPRATESLKRVWVVFRVAGRTHLAGEISKEGVGGVVGHAVAQD